MNRRTLTRNLLLGAVAIATGACSKIGPQKPKNAEPPAASNKELYQVDLSKPEGPMFQVLRAAQDRDLDLFRASFAPTADTSAYDETAFRKFRKKVLTNKVTPVPESVQQLSDTEAIVKLRNSRGREIPLRVQKFDDKWLIVGGTVGDKTKQRFRERTGGGAQKAG